MSYYYTQIFKRYQPKVIGLSGSFDELRNDFKATNLLVCGESHGVRENADLAYSLCKTLGVKQLAIERSASKFEPFVQSAIKGLPDFLLPQVLPSLQASVLSLEMLKTIVTLIRENAITSVRYIDLDSTKNTATDKLEGKDYMRVREREMARNISLLDASSPTMAVLGNYHTREKTDRTVGESALQIARQARRVTCA